MANKNPSRTPSGANQPTTGRRPAANNVQWRLAPWLPLLLLVLGALVYANGLRGPFVFDDVKHIIESPQAQQLTLDVRSGRPLLFFSLAVNYWLSGFDTWSYKLLNLLVHLMASLALYGLVRRTLLLPRFGGQFQRTAAGLAFAVAALWVVHPLTTEAVTYIIHRGESMMGLFALVLMYCLLRGAQAERLWSAWLWYAAAIAACGLGFWSKPWMIAVPVVALLYDRIMLGGPWKEWAVRRGAFYLLLLSPLVWAFWINSADARARLSTSDDSPSVRTPVAVTHSSSAKPGDAPPATAADPDFETGFPPRLSPLRYARSQPGVIAYYLKLVFSPYPLCADYFWKPADTPGRIVPPALLIGGLVLATCWALWRYPAWGFLGAAFFLLLGPSSSFIPIEDLATERRMYLPLAAVITLLVLSAWQLLGWAARSSQPNPEIAERQQRVRGLAALLVVLAIWSGLTILRNFDYTSDVDFCQRVVEQVPYNSRARVNLARALTNRGDTMNTLQQRAAHYQLALEYLEEAESDAPQSAYLHAQIGHILAQQAEMESAAQQPDWEKRRASLLDQARRRFQRATGLSSDNALFHVNLAVVHELRGSPHDLQSALKHYQRAVEIPNKPGDLAATAHHGYGRVLAATQQYEKAIEQHERALQIRRNWIEAEMNLASALFMAGRPQEAIALSKKSLRQAEAAGNQEHAAMIRSRLRQYESAAGRRGG